MNLNNITLEGINAELCSRRLYTFVQEFWECADPSTPIFNTHMEYLCDELQPDLERVINNKPKENDIIVNCPPGVSKSMIISVMIPVWILVRRASTRVMTASFSNTIALELSTKSRNLMNSDKFKLYYPNLILKDDQNTKSNYKTNEGGGRFVTSTGSNVLGNHSDLIIGDDLENLTSVNSATGRAGVRSWVSGTLSTRKTDKVNTLMIYVQQRLHPLDLTSYLLSNGGKYKHIVLPAKLSDKVKPIEAKRIYKDGYLDGRRLGDKALEILKRDLGSRNYKAQIDQDPEDDKSSIIKRSWIDIVNIKVIEEFKEYERFYVLDTAYGEKSSDYNVILDCITKDNHLYIVNCVRVIEEFPEFIKTIKRECKDSKKLYIEGKASGKSIIQQLKNDTNFDIIELTPTDSKIVRLNAISPTVEGRRVTLIEDNWNEVALDEITTNYPPNDDIRDCFTYAVRILEDSMEDGNYDII